jgi:TPR repeat protein
MLAQSQQCSSLALAPIKNQLAQDKYKNAVRNLGFLDQKLQTSTVHGPLFRHQFQVVINPTKSCIKVAPYAHVAPCTDETDEALVLNTGNQVSSFSMEQQSIALNNKRLSGVSAVDSAYGSLPREEYDIYTAGQVVLSKLLPPGSVYSNEQLVEALIAKFSKGKAVDAGAMLKYLSPNGALVTAQVLDEKCFKEFKGLTYSYLDSHLIISLYRFALGFADNILAKSMQMGLKYMKGDGVAQNFGQAFACFHRAVENISDRETDEAAQALACLAMCYFKGCGITQDIKKGLELFIHATQYTQIAAKFELVRFVGIEPLPENCHELFTQWVGPLIASGFPPAQYLAGVWHSRGYHGFQVDLRLAAGLFGLSAQNGYTHAQFNIGACFLHGIGVDPNPQEGTRWLLQAAAQGFGPAKAVLEKSGTKNCLVVTEQDLHLVQLDRNFGDSWDILKF